MKVKTYENLENITRTVLIIEIANFCKTSSRSEVFFAFNGVEATKTWMRFLCLLITILWAEKTTVRKKFQRKEEQFPKEVKPFECTS